MRKKQRKVSRTMGNDTHVRDKYDNIFNESVRGSYSMLMGEISIPKYEPIFKQTMVNVEFANGGGISDVAIPGAFISPLTKQLHGTYEGPLPGQMVMVGFEEGNKNRPFIVNRYPYQGKSSILTQFDYIAPLFRARYDPTDVMMGHFTGSFLSFNTGLTTGRIPASVTLSAMTNLNLEANLMLNIESFISVDVWSPLINIDGLVSVNLSSPMINIESFATMDLSSPVINIDGLASLNMSSALINVSSPAGGNIDVDALIDISNAVTSLGGIMNSILTNLIGLGTLVTTPVGPGTGLLNPASIAALTADQVEVNLLLK